MVKVHLQNGTNLFICTLPNHPRCSCAQECLGRHLVGWFTGPHGQESLQERPGLWLVPNHIFPAIPSIFHAGYVHSLVTIQVQCEFPIARTGARSLLTCRQIPFYTCWMHSLVTTRQCHLLHDVCTGSRFHLIKISILPHIHIALNFPLTVNKTLTPVHYIALLSITCLKVLWYLWRLFHVLIAVPTWTNRCIHTVLQLFMSRFSLMWDTPLFPAVSECTLWCDDWSIETVGLCCG